MATPRRIRAQICGEVVLEIDGRRVERDLPGGQGRLLFVYLTSNRLRSIGREELVAALWEDHPPAEPDGALRVLLSKLRRVLGPEVLPPGGEVRLRFPSDTRIDLEAARDAIHRAESALALGEWERAWSASQVSLFTARRGFLPGEERGWIEEQRRELEELHLRSLECYAKASLEIGGTELAAAERCGREMVARSPYRESGYRLLMLALARGGNSAEALHVYERLRGLLRAELGIVPSAGLRESPRVPASGGCRERASKSPGSRRGVTHFQVVDGRTPLRNGHLPLHRRRRLEAAARARRRRICGGAPEHRRILRKAFRAHGGVEVDTQGDAFFVAFPTAPGALEAAAEAKKALASGPIRVRMGIHTGTPYLGSEGYVGEDVHLGARIAASGHGGQILVSKETCGLVSAELEDLGEHRLKDFAEPVWIYQLGSERFPPLKTISNTNLPRPASSFVGREREVAEVTALFEDGARFVTLSGPGGSGKTRLAIEAASDLVSEFKNGTFWVGLAALRDPHLVGETIAKTLGAKDGLAEHIGEQELLLLVDNLEQVVEAGPELATLVERCPNLTLLVTSRELLRVRGEVEYAVPPLALPEALELFCRRSQLRQDETIAELCRRLDNLPLAIELAAARTSVLSPAQILARLSTGLDLLTGGRDAEARQRTLRATIEWSYDLLDDEEKRVFARLAVFAGGCTLEAAEEVAEADLDTLQSLVDKSLVRHSQERFWMLETIREYAGERLEASGEADELRRTHAEHFLALAEEAEPNLHWYSAEWIERLQREHDNMRAALEQFDASGGGKRVQRLAGALGDFWIYGGHVAEARRRLEGALDADEYQTAARAKALSRLAEIVYRSGDPATSRVLDEEALELYRRFGDTEGAAVSLWGLGLAFIEQGDFEPARRAFEESAELLRQVGDTRGVVGVTRALAFAYHDHGDYEHARKLHEENLREIRTLGLKEMEAATLGSLGMIALEQGRADDAHGLGKESLIAWRDVGSPHGIAQALCHAAADLALLRGKTETAARLLSWFEAQREQIGVSEAWVTRMNERTLATVRTGLDEAAFAEAWEQGRTLTADEAVALAVDSLG